MKKDMARVSIAACAAAAFVAATLALFGCSSGAASSSSSAAASSGGTAPVQQDQGSDAVGAGPMAVTLELKDSLPDEYVPDSPNQFAEETLTVNAQQDATAFEVLQASGRDVKTTGSGDSLEIDSIGGLARGDGGTGSHWQMSVNGEVQRTSPNVTVMKSGDTLTFDFVQQDGAK